MRRFRYLRRQRRIAADWHAHKDLCIELTRRRRPPGGARAHSRRRRPGPGSAPAGWRDGANKLVHVFGRVLFGSRSEYNLCSYKLYNSHKPPPGPLPSCEATNRYQYNCPAKASESDDANSLKRASGIAGSTAVTSSSRPRRACVAAAGSLGARTGASSFCLGPEDDAGRRSRAGHCSPRPRVGRGPD